MRLLNRFKFLVCWVFLFTIVLNNISVVYAGSSPDALTAEQLSNAEKLYIFLVNEMGVTKECACGILGNCDAESVFDTRCNATTYPRGAFQMSSSNWAGFANWCSSEGQDQWDICVQAKYVMGCCTREIGGYSTISYEEWIKTDDVVVGAEAFMIGYERCVCPPNYSPYTPTKVFNKSNSGKQYQAGASRVQWAQDFLKKFAGVDVKSAKSNNTSSDDTNKEKSNEDESDSKEVTTGYVSPITGNVYSEEMLSSYKKLAQLNIADEFLKDAGRDSLGQESVTNISNWERNTREEILPIRILRTCIQFFGIVMTIWGILIYIAYWFDYLNNFVNFDIMGKISFGKLHCAPDESLSNFQMSTTRESARLGHRDVLKISIIAILTGVLIMSGLLYNFIAKIVNSALQLFT